MAKDKEGGEPVVLLNEHNLAMWLVDIRAKLRKKELWQYTQGPSKTSIVLTGFVVGTKYTDEEKKQIEAERTEQKKQIVEERAIWMNNAMKAADVMTPRISSIVKQRLESKHFDDGFAMMTRLHELLQPSGDAQFMRLIKQFYSIKSIEYKDMTSYLTEIKTLDEQITATKVELTRDKRIIIAIVMGLPKEYQGLTQIWSCMPELTAELARSMLLEEERRQRNADENGLPAGTSVAYKATAAADGKKCPHCKRAWHPAEQCRKLHPENAPDWFKEMKKNGGSKDATTSYAYTFGNGAVGT